MSTRTRRSFAAWGGIEVGSGAKLDSVGVSGAGEARWRRGRVEVTELDSGSAPRGHSNVNADGAVIRRVGRN
jgi:hypothetical protein